jgi:DHA2 family multidrug resistance protein
MMPILPLLLSKVNIRWMVLCGLLCFATSCFLDTDLTAQSSGANFVMSQLLRGFGQILSFMPLNQASVGAVSREDAGDAAGLYNMARNLGGSLGLSVLGIFIDRRVEGHADAIRETMTANSPLVQERMAAQAASFAGPGGDLAYGRMQTLQSWAATIHQQAIVITYSECFWVLGVALLAMMPLILLLKPPPRGAAPPTEAH